MRLLGIVGSPNPGGRSATALRAFLDAAGGGDVVREIVELADGPDVGRVQDAMERADGIVFATPTYRARSSSLVKQLLEDTERGVAGETSRGQGRAPLLGKATAIIHTGATAHHFLAVDDLRSILAGFFAAQLLSPGLYLHGEHFGDDGELADAAAALAAAHGRAFAAFTAAVRAAPDVTALRPLM